jgi:hypothetical protein
MADRTYRIGACSYVWQPDRLLVRFWNGPGAFVQLGGGERVAYSGTAPVKIEVVGPPGASTKDAATLPRNHDIFGTKVTDLVFHGRVEVGGEKRGEVEYLVVRSAGDPKLSIPGNFPVAEKALADARELILDGDPHSPRTLEFGVPDRGSAAKRHGRR